MYPYNNDESLKDMYSTTPNGVCLIRLSASDEPQSQPLACNGRTCKRPANVLVIDVLDLIDVNMAVRMPILLLCPHQNSSSPLVFDVIGRGKPRLIGPRIIRTDAANYRTCAVEREREVISITARTPRRE